MTIATYGTHTCPHDGRTLIPCATTKDTYECGFCHSFFVGETLTNEFKAGDSYRPHYGGN